MAEKMMGAISRREFLVLSGCGATALLLAADPALVAAAPNEVPTLLDHILLGCGDLDRGIAFVEERTGVRAAIGGVHPGRGTRNALLSLGERRYLEIIAPDPAQHDAADTYGLRKLGEPRLIGWAANPQDIATLAKRIEQQGIAAEGPTPGSRKRPDGKLLQWKTLNLKETADGLLPFFIQWSADTLHPSADSPKGCTLIRFEAVTPHAEALAATAKQLELDLPTAKGEQAQLRALIRSPKGELTLTS